MMKEERLFIKFFSHFFVSVILKIWFLNLLKLWSSNILHVYIYEISIVIAIRTLHGKATVLYVFYCDVI